MVKESYIWNGSNCNNKIVCWLWSTHHTNNKACKLLLFVFCCFIIFQSDSNVLGFDRIISFQNNCFIWYNWVIASRTYVCNTSKYTHTNAVIAYLVWLISIILYSIFFILFRIVWTFRLAGYGQFTFIDVAQMDIIENGYSFVGLTRFVRESYFYSNNNINLK